MRRVTSLAVLVLGLDDHGVAVVGAVPSGLATPANPPWSWHDVQVLLPTAFAITLISILEAMTLAREFAEEHGYDMNPNEEIAAIGASNVAARFLPGHGRDQRNHALDDPRRGRGPGPSLRVPSRR